ncbi:uncharacterized protein LOC125653992 isoform X2 [Ostrea edulis]|uniref:uncharacterized protein LOC125653992 isoform X2 n=1 Tax=Ostrea edulis TaxID=37623 RepID=UPI0024AF8FE6|nr:uncharacterized protein LOC125653992 isoform X2 [Ostrea edulis]
MNMSSSRMINRRNIAIVLFIVIGIYGTQYMFKNLYLNDQLYESIRMAHVSPAFVPSCELPGNLFTEVGEIRTPNLTQVGSIFPHIKTDKCIGSVKWKPIQPFTQLELTRFNKCTGNHADPKIVSADSMRRLDYTVIYSFFTFLKRKSDVAIVELGGYTGKLLKNLIPTTGAKYYVVIEPVPSFYSTLSKNILMLRLNSSVTAYNFGLGKQYKELAVGVRGDATALFKKSLGKETELIRIVSIVDFFIQLGLGCRSLDLLTINCEGCEFDILETLISTNLIEKFEYIQFQPHHAVPNLGNYTCRYCRLRQLLARTHVVAYDYPQVWEAWKSKKLIK